MIKFHFLLCFLTSLLFKESKSSTTVINWNNKNWSWSCDFHGNDFKHRPTKDYLCAELCFRTKQCTHYTWSSWNGGTCWLKKGYIRKSKAIPKRDSTTLCGIIDRSTLRKPNYSVSTCQPACPPGLCCSKWGFCGNTSIHCQGQSATVAAISLIRRDQFDCIFDEIDSKLRDNRWKGFQEAIRLVSFKPTTSHEVMIFLAHVSHETDGLKTYREYCAVKGSCQNRYQVASWCGSIKAKPGRKYFGRGWFQLSYPCNYYSAGKALGVDLWSNPDLVARSDKLACATALWFWNERRMNVAAEKLDFASTTRLINSAECGSSQSQTDRIQRYQKARRCFSMPPASEQLRC